MTRMKPHAAARRDYAYWLRDHEGLLYKDIGKRLGVSESRAHQLVYMGERRRFRYMDYIIDASVEHAWRLRSEGLELAEIAARVPTAFYGDFGDLEWLDECIKNFGEFDVGPAVCRIV